MGHRSLSNVIGVDDAPFPRAHRGNVKIVATVYAGLRFDGVLIGQVRRDGRNATATVARMIAESRFREHVQLVLLQGVALAGFNVVDVPELCRRLSVPALVVMRRAPDMAAVQRALLARVPGGADKWTLVERLGPPEPVLDVYVQRIGITPAETLDVVRRLAVNGHIPEPLRTAHLIAGAIGLGHSRGRA